MTATFFDPANYLTTLKAILKDVYQYNGGGASGTAFGHYRQTANKIRGFYWDLYGGGGNLSPYQHAPSLDPNGVSEDWEPNKAEMVDYVRAQMRALDASFYTTTEAPEEGLIGAIDAMHTGGVGETPGLTPWGVNVGSFGIVYSRYQAILNLGITLNDAATDPGTIPSSQNFYYTAWVNASFHFSGHLCVSNGTVNPLIPTNPPTLANCPMFVMLLYMKSIITKLNATPMIRKYMRRGLRMRPLPDSWEGDLAESGKTMGTYLSEASGDSTLLTTIRQFSSVWLLPDADDDYTTTSYCLGIVISSCNIETVTYNIYIEAEAYEMSKDSVKILYSRVGATRTEITRFTDVLDYDATITFDGSTAPCVLYEIVQV